MFLAGLTEKQKAAFMDLAYALIQVDGILREDEMAMMEQYKREMSLTVSLDEVQGETEQAVSVFQAAPAATKKQIIFELVALACADKEYADTEHVLIEKIGGALELTTDFINECKTHVTELNGLYERIGNLVGE